MKNYLNEGKIEYSFENVNIKEIDCSYFLNTNSPDAIVLAILCDFKDKKPIEVSKNILLKLHQLLDEKEFRRYVIMLEELSELRNLQNTIKEAEVGLMSIKWEDLPSYEIGMEKGFEVGMQQGIQQGIQEERKKMLKAMIELGVPIDSIISKLNIDENEIKKIKGEL
jgi:predicted transposase/invertase (TIGR01784 family)